MTPAQHKTAAINLIGPKLNSVEQGLLEAHALLAQCLGTGAQYNAADGLVTTVTSNNPCATVAQFQANLDSLTEAQTRALLADR